MGCTLFLQPLFGQAENADVASDMEALQAKPQQEADLEEEEMNFITRSVNISEEFLTGTAETMNRFLGEIENPLRPLGKKETYKGTVSEDGKKGDRWYD